MTPRPQPAGPIHPTPSNRVRKWTSEVRFRGRLARRRSIVEVMS